MKRPSHSIALMRQHADTTLLTCLTVALALLFCFVFSRPVFANPGLRMEDPLFGLSFDPAEVQFEQLDALPCAAGGDQFPPYFVFAHARRGETAAWILNHWVPTGGDGPGHEHTEPAYGIVLRQSQGECRLVATPDALEQDPEAVAPRLSQALYRDAARRYIGAYEGADAFTAALATASARGCLDLAPALRRALMRASVEPPPDCLPLTRAGERESELRTTAAPQARPSPNRTEPVLGPGWACRSTGTAPESVARP